MTEDAIAVSFRATEGSRGIHHGCCDYAQHDKTYAPMKTVFSALCLLEGMK